MIELKIDVKKIVYILLGIVILYAISRAYKMQNDKTESVKKLIPDKETPFVLSQSLQKQIDDLALKQWEEANRKVQSFEVTFTDTQSVIIPATEHKINTVTNILVLSVQGNSLTHGLNINPENQSVTVTFLENQSGKILIS